MNDTNSSVSADIARASETSTPPAHIIDSLQRRNAELQQENARLLEAVASRDAFLAMAAHELRNPMTPIVGRVGMLRGMIAKPGFKLEKLDHSLEHIEWLIARYMQRATMLLDVSRFNTGMFQFDPAPVDVCTVIREVADALQPVAAYTDSSIALELPGDDLLITGDHLALEQIIDNLVSNAIKYGAGTPVCISATVDAERDVAIICVRDDGPGIDAANQARIFEKFERAVSCGQQQNGFGVGLWLVRQLTKAMGGAIAVHSGLGKGTTFRIMLPLSPADTAP